MKILLVEDVRVERAILKHWLEELDCEVIEASNGNEGWDMFYDHQPDLIITDILMPEKEGIQMIIDLKGDFPDVKIFAISGAGIKDPGEYLSIAKDVGALRTFVKPIGKGELLTAVVEYFPETNPN